MKRYIEKAISIALGLIIFCMIAAGVIAILGGSLMGIVTIVAGVPLALPMTTLLVIGVIAVVLILKRK